jgi:uncharacterized protein (TIGR03435 family)
MINSSVLRRMKLRSKKTLNLAGSVTLAASLAIGLVNVNQLRAQATAPSPAPAAAPHLTQDIADTWQGTLHAGKDLRVVVKISKADGGGYKGVFHAIDQPVPPLNLTTVTLQGTTMKFTLNLAGVTYEGKLSADGKTIDGNWSQGPNAVPLVLTRATPETAWAIPEPPPQQPPMAENADPNFEVATIKPNISGAASMQGLTLQGRNFATRNSSLADLISFAYNVQVKQIVGGPDWMDKDRYDIAAVPEQEGVPNGEQLKIMMRKLIVDRFAMKFHTDKKEMSAYVLTVGKIGQKLNPTQLKGPLPGISIRPGTGGITLNMVNATIGDFTGFLQILVLDRPVVDRTGIQGRFDYQCTFAPDDSQFNGHPPIPPQANSADAAPGLFDAIQQQLGLKLDAEKTDVDVISIDHVEKPSQN